MKLQNLNEWYSIDHKKVNENFEGDYTFLGTFCIKDQYAPSAVYLNSNPNKEKNHKKYMALTKTDENWFIQGCDEEEMEKYRFQSAIHCKKCDCVIYSVMRHDFHSCQCGDIKIDGGKDYLKYGFKKDAQFEICKIDFVDQEVLLEDKLAKIPIAYKINGLGIFNIMDIDYGRKRTENIKQKT